MEIGLARGAALFRGPVLTQPSFAQGAVDDRAAGDVQGLADGDRAKAAQDKPLDIQELRGLVDHRGARHHHGRGRPGQVEAPAPGPGERPHEGHTHGPDDPHRPVPGQGEGADAGPPPGQRADEPDPGEEAPGQKSAAGGSEELSEDDKRIVESLQRRDRAVRAHEAAHLAAAGAYAAGGPSYTTEQGPDGRSYAIGGEVPIDMSAERTPEATLRKAQTVAAAAMAPADPSGADKAIAAAAAQMAENAQAAISAEAAAKIEERAAEVEERRAQADEAKAKAESAKNDKGVAGDKDDETSGPTSAASSEGFAALREGLSEVAPTRPKQVPTNRRNQLSKAYVAMAQTPARATLRCASCSGFH